MIEVITGSLQLLIQLVWLATLLVLLFVVLQFHKNLQGKDKKLFHIGIGFVAIRYAFAFFPFWGEITILINLVGKIGFLLILFGIVGFFKTLNEQRSGLITTNKKLNDDLDLKSNQVSGHYITSKKPKKIESILFLGWPVWSCLISGVLAVFLDCSDPWGSDVFLVYAIPFPMFMGMFHIPSLIVTTSLLYVYYGTRARWVSFALLILSVAALVFVTNTHLTTDDDDPASRMEFVWYAVDPTIALILTLVFGTTKAQPVGVSND